MSNKKAQLSDVMTWIIATIAIIGILIIFIYASTLFAQKTKAIHTQNLLLERDNTVDLLETKTRVVYSSATTSQKNLIDKWKMENES